MQELLDKLRSWLGADAVVEGAFAWDHLGHCTTGRERPIAAVVYARNVDDIVTIVGVAGQYRVPLYPISTGRNWGYGNSPVTDDCIVLNLSRLNSIVEPLDPITGVITIEPGVTQGSLAEYLDTERLAFLVPTSGAGPSASIVGNALERGHGITPIADHFGAVTAIEAVLPDGSIYRSPHLALGALRGGQACKWGIGPYLDGLFAQGSFGIVTKMTLALARRPERIKAFVCGIANETTLEPVIAAVQRIVENLPGVLGGINVMNAHRVLSMSAPYPRDGVGPDGVIPAALLARMRARHAVTPWTVFGTLYGTKGMVAAAQREVRAALAPFTSKLKTSRLTFISPETAKLLHRMASKVPVVRQRLGRTLSTLSSSMTIVGGRPNRTAMPLAYWRSGRPVDISSPLDPGRDGCGLIWYAPLVEAKPEAVRRHVEIVGELMPRFGMEPMITLITLSERCFVSTVPLLFDLGSAKEAAAAQHCLAALLESGAEQGFFPYRVGSQSMEWLMAKAPRYWRLVGELKRAIDPNGIIAPGRYAPLDTGRDQVAGLLGPS